MVHRILFLIPMVLVAGCSEPPATEPVQSAESRTPIEAVAAKPETFDWPIVSSEDGMFRVQLPSPGSAITKNVKSPKGSIHMAFHKGYDMNGMFFKLIEATFPEGHAEFFSSPVGLLEKPAEGARLQKENCEIEDARRLEGLSPPSFEMSLTYPEGVTAFFRIPGLSFLPDWRYGLSGVC